MIWATDSIGLHIILTPEGIDECFANMPATQNGEIRTTQLLRDNGYDVEVFLSVYHSKDVETKQRILNGPDTEIEEAASDSESEVEDAEANPDTVERDSESDTDTEETNTGPKPPTSPNQEEQGSPSSAQKRQIEVSPPNPNPPSISTSSVPGDFWKSCTDEDWLGPGSYFGTFVHPYENLFMKSHRHIEDTVLDRLTEWHDGAGYSSYDVCF
jgi:hypothetical protein